MISELKFAVRKSRVLIIAELCHIYRLLVNYSMHTLMLKPAIVDKRNERAIDDTAIVAMRFNKYKFIKLENMPVVLKQHGSCLAFDCMKVIPLLHML